MVAKFDGGRLCSDGGAVLLRAANQAFQVTGRLAACFIDHRNPARVEHSLESLLGQRVFALALALAGSSTLNRLELGTLLEADEDRYKKVVASTEQIDDLLVDLFLDMHETLLERIVLDVDATDDQLHGQQEGRFYHGYYRHYCYLPLYITCGEHVLCARLRTAQAEAAEGTVAELERIVRRIRQRWPQAAIVVRGDAGFCRDTLMTWCEQRRVVGKAEWLPGSCTRNCTAPAARWRIGSRSNSWICSRTAHRRRRCGRTSCGCTFRCSPARCCWIGGQGVARDERRRRPDWSDVARRGARPGGSAPGLRARRPAGLPRGPLLAGLGSGSELESLRIPWMATNLRD